MNEVQSRTGADWLLSLYLLPPLITHAHYTFIPMCVTTALYVCFYILPGCVGYFFVFRAVQRSKCTGSYDTVYEVSV